MLWPEFGWPKRRRFETVTIPMVPIPPSPTPPPPPETVNYGSDRWYDPKDGGGVYVSAEADSSVPNVVLSVRSRYGTRPYAPASLTAQEARLIGEKLIAAADALENDPLKNGIIWEKILRKHIEYAVDRWFDVGPAVKKMTRAQLIDMATVRGATGYSDFRNHLRVSLLTR